MFSERLEKLIQSSLQDGILTDQEKAAIIKRAKAEGEDIDEVEIYIDSLLQKRQKELNNSDVKRKANTSGMDELKKLIDAAMADGIITSKEREVIIRKAATLGIDAAEVEVYLDAEIQKTEQAADMAKRDKIGPVCPQCGKQVPPLTLKCECGYEFTNAKRSYSMQILSERLNAISLTDDELKEIEKAAPAVKAGKRSDFLASKQINMITTFPVPNTKEDIIDFLSTSISLANKEIGFLDKKKNCFIVVVLAGIIIPLVGWIWGAIFMMAKSFSEEKLKQAWRAKSEQVLIKGRSLRGDSEFTQQLDYYENLLRE
jgi:hypothetical protein